MSRLEKIQAIMEEAVSEVFAAALPRLRADVVSRAVAELQSLEPAPGNLPTDWLSAAASSIQEAVSQAEILRHLLEGTARFSGRTALFVIKGGTMNGWQGIGFEDNDAVKTFSSSASTGLADQAIRVRTPIGGPAQEFDSGFLAAVGTPADGNCVVLPLLVKEKVAALIYADSGLLPETTLDVSALSVLCRFAALWLELTALRKAGIAAPTEEAQAPVATAPQPAATAAQAKDGAAAGAIPAVEAVEEDDVHRKARRFAKLLVDEIKLYNQSKVAEGKRNRDLYDRLKEDIEKSRATYQKRFGETPAASANYFTQELVRALADNDVSLLGGNFPS